MILVAAVRFSSGYDGELMFQVKFEIRLHTMGTCWRPIWLHHLYR